jgi:cyclic pyranopterin phosphate synthase
MGLNAGGTTGTRANEIDSWRMGNSMLYKFENGKVQTQGLEYSVSYHCNLRCAGCSHLSPFSEKRFPSLQSFQADIIKLSEGLHASEIRLLGGEPLLNPEISAYIKVAKESGIADIVTVTTNGLLLHTMNDDFWEHVDLVKITAYPSFEPKEKFAKIFKERASESDTRLELNSIDLFRTTIVTEPHPKDWITDMIFRTCKNVHLWHCHMIHEGKLYKCAVPPFLSEYLMKIDRDGYDPEADAFDIHNAPTNIYQDLRRFLTSSKTIDACRFCLGYVGKIQKHHQLDTEYIRHPDYQNIRRTTHLDAKLILKESLLFYSRRCSEQLTGNQSW